MSHKFRVYLAWACWTFGVCGPRAGCVVFSLHVGPMILEFWPLARSADLDF